jgi:uncharacterized membrane protein YwaF
LLIHHEQNDDGRQRDNAHDYCRQRGSGYTTIISFGILNRFCMHFFATRARRFNYHSAMFGLLFLIGHFNFSFVLKSKMWRTKIEERSSSNLLSVDLCANAIPTSGATLFCRNEL